MRSGRAATLDPTSRAPDFDWRAFALLFLVIAVSWLGAVAFTDLNKLGLGEPDVTTQVSR
jgi:hypothetical protein